METNMDTVDRQGTLPLKDESRPDLNNKSQSEEDFKRHEVESPVRQRCFSLHKSSYWTDLSIGKKFHRLVTNTKMDTSEADETNNLKLSVVSKMDGKDFNPKTPAKENYTKFNGTAENGRFKARLQAASAGLRELAILREAQQALVDQAKSMIKKNEKNLHDNFEQPETYEVCTTFY